MDYLQRYKFQPPTWNSEKREKWPEFKTNFESFVHCCGGGELLETLLQQRAMHKGLVPTASLARSSRDAASLADESQDAVSEEASLEEPSPRASRATQSLPEIDTTLYHVLKLSITGPAYNTVLHVTRPSFVEAFKLLSTEYGAANCRRKTALIRELMSFTFDGDINKFKDKALALLRAIFEVDITVEDIIVSSLIGAFKSEDFQAFKLLTAKRVDEGEDINLFDFVQNIVTSIELANEDKVQSASVNHARPGCSRCGHKSHTKDKCAAKKHKNGTILTDRPPGSRPPRRKQAKGAPAEDNQNGYDKLSDAMDQFKAGGKKPSLDDVKAAVARATCLHIRKQAAAAPEEVTPSAEPSSPCSTDDYDGNDFIDDLNELCAPPTSTAKCNHTVVLDSGSGAHLFRDVNVTDANSIIAISGYDGQATSTSSGKGTSRVSTCTLDDAPLSLEIKGADRVADLPQDIVSLGLVIEDEDMEFHASRAGSYLQTSDGDRIRVSIQDGIFVIESGTSCSYVKSSQQKVTWQRLHAKLGHVSNKTMIDTLHNTYGLRCDLRDLIDQFCPVCAIAKSVRQGISHSANPEPDIEITGPRQLFYSDMKTVQREENTPHLVRVQIYYVDAYSGFVDVWDLERKSDSVATVQELKLRHGLERAVIKTDGCGSYGPAFTAACSNLNLIHETLPPYTPQHNLAERSIYSIDAKARTALVDAPHVEFFEYYPKAVHHSAYVHNRTLGSRGCTPYELLKGVQPMISHLVPFGCIGYMHADKDSAKRKRLPPGHRAEEVLMIGYRSPFSRQWKVELRDASKRILHSIHVDWNEDGHGLGNTLSSEDMEALVDELAKVSDDPTSTISSPAGASPEAAPSEDEPQPEPSSSPVSKSSERAPSSAISNIGNLDFSEQNSDGVQSQAQIETPILETNDFNEFDEHDAPLQDDTFWGHNEFGDVSDAHILNEPRRCNHTTVLNYAKIHKVQTEIALKTAMRSEQREGWLEAVRREINALLEHTLVQVHPGDDDYSQAVDTATRSRIVLTLKRDGRKKARWVVQGCFESNELDDFSNRSYVATFNALRALVFRHDRAHRRMGAVDISTAFLQSDRYEPDEPTRFIKLEDPEKPGHWLYFRLLGPMYGQRSAPVRWETTLAPWLQSQGFQRGCNERSVYHRSSDGATILVYVDDILYDLDDATEASFLNELRQRFKINEPVVLSADTPLDFIGIEISIDSEHIHLGMKTYSLKLLANLGMSEANPRRVPLRGPAEDQTPLDAEDAKQYRSGVGGIGWLACTVRPDLAYAFSRLGQHVAQPCVGAMSNLKQTLRYLAGTVDQGLSAPLDLTENVFTFYCDSDHGGNTEPQNRRRSQSGWIALMNGTPILWKSTAQSITATSSTEAEIYAASGAIQAFMQLSYVIEELGLTGFPRPLTLYVDNSAAQIFIEDTCDYSRLKHIDCRQKWVQDMRNADVIEACHIPSEDNLADIFTKILAGPLFHKLKSFLLKVLPKQASKHHATSMEAC